MRYLALCCIVKDEGPFLREWLAYHAHIGVEHFFLYDNGSTPSVRESLGAFAGSDKVTVIGTTGKSMQITAYNHCLSEFGTRFHWIAFCDADEFICSRADDDIRPCLAEFEPYGGLALSWRMFSSSGHEERPQGLVIDAYTHCLTQADPHVKSIVQPGKVTGCRNPHAFGYAQGQFCVNEDHEPIPQGSPFWLPAHKKLWVNHYFYKSRQDFTEKLQRGRNSPGLETSNRWNMGLFDNHLDKPTTVDTTITRFSAPVRAALKAGALPESALPPLEDAPLGTVLLSVSDCLRKGDERGANVALCHAAARWPGLAEIWTMRATLARNARNLDKAARFVRRAFELGETPELYAELFQVCRAQGQTARAVEACRLLRLWLNRSGGADPAWANRVTAMEQMVKGQAK